MLYTMMIITNCIKIYININITSISMYKKQNTHNQLDKPLKFITENMYDVKNDNSMKNPVHIEPYHIPYLFQLMKHKEKLLITPKADGIPTQIVLTDMMLATEKINSATGADYHIIDVVRMIKCNIDTHRYSTIDRRLSLLSSYLSHDSKNNVIISLNLTIANIMNIQTFISNILS